MGQYDVAYFNSLGITMGNIYMINISMSAFTNMSVIAGEGVDYSYFTDRCIVL